MNPLTYHLRVMVVDDDPAQRELVGTFWDNRDLRYQTPARIYRTLRELNIIKPASEIMQGSDLDHRVDALFRNPSLAEAGEIDWPLKSELSQVLRINPEIDDEFKIVEPVEARDAAHAVKVWKELRNSYNSSSPSEIYCDIATLDHDMPGITGMELAQEWRKSMIEKRKGMVYSESPFILFYTGKGPNLAANFKEYYDADLDNITTVNLAEGVLSKGISFSDFNKHVWNILDKRACDLPREN